MTVQTKAPATWFHSQAVKSTRRSVNNGMRRTHMRFNVNVFGYICRDVAEGIFGKEKGLYSSVTRDGENH